MEKYGGFPKIGGIIMEMDNFTFGVTLLIVGMGGTLVTLAIMASVMAVLGKIFPEKPEKEG
jgi:Na+-transporting methylmalonyl-CoA/oxaloacetate decarboxylase gamma subunit